MVHINLTYLRTQSTYFFLMYSEFPDYQQRWMDPEEAALLPFGSKIMYTYTITFPYPLLGPSLFFRYDLGLVLKDSIPHNSIMTAQQYACNLSCRVD